MSKLSKEQKTAQHSPYGGSAGPGRWRPALLLALSVATVMSGLFATVVAEAQTAIIQPGPNTSHDIWTTSVYSYAPGGSYPGGGLADNTLRVGGWGDLYYSLLQFNLSSMPRFASSATLSVFDSGSGTGTPVGMNLAQITQPWNWKTAGTGRDHNRLWWADRPNTQTIATNLPAPTPGHWENINITSLYNSWQSGTTPNYGVELQPTSNWNQFNNFYSSRYLGNPSLRPKITVTPYIPMVPATHSPPAPFKTLPKTGTLVVWILGSPGHPGQFVPATTTKGTVGYINPSAPTAVLTHGFASSPSDLWGNGFAASLAASEPATNILAWDWKSAAAAPAGYNLAEKLAEALPAATYNTQEEGLTLGTDLANILGSHYSQSIHFYGHSLGTLVNAKAINTFYNSDSTAKIQDTLFDNAEVANVVGQLEGIQNSTFGAFPDTGTNAVVDNYISSFGSLGSQAVNVILNHGIANHSYPISWYQQTIGKTDPSLWGMGAQFNGSQTVPGEDFAQLNPFNENSLTPITGKMASGILGLRDRAEKLVGVPVFIGWLTLSYLSGVSQGLGNATANIITLPPDSLNNNTPEFGPQIILPKGTSSTVFGPVLRAANAGLKTTAATSNAANSSYAWLPISIPGNAQFLSLDFTFQGLSPGDFLTAGINNTLLFQLQDRFVTEGVVTNSGFLDVSQWSGQEVQLFLGLTASDANNLGGAITINNIAFESVPEPSALAMLAIGSLALLRRRRAA